MTKYSSATERKINKIRETYGDDWKKTQKGKSIDSLYSEIIGDTRQTVYCKIQPEHKIHLEQIADFYDLNIAETIERLVNEEYVRVSEKRNHIVKNLVDQFSI